MISAALAILFLQIESLPPAQAEERLISWAVSDFREHLPGPARSFRAVHVASLEHSEGVVRPLLCGEVQVEIAGSAEWMSFATLETISGYEQWLGGSASTWCNDGTERDLSRDLSRRLEAEVVFSRSQ